VTQEVEPGRQSEGREDGIVQGGYGKMLTHRTALRLCEWMV
jgi:hypothetical protein